MQTKKPHKKPQTNKTVHRSISLKKNKQQKKQQEVVSIILSYVFLGSRARYINTAELLNFAALLTSVTEGVTSSHRTALWYLLGSTQKKKKTTHSVGLQKAENPRDRKTDITPRCSIPLVLPHAIGQSYQVRNQNVFTAFIITLANNPFNWL